MPKQHTPGPWVCAENVFAGGFDVWMGKAVDPRERGSYSSLHRIEMYDDIRPEDDGFSEAEANALLIAAAPELLEACRFMAAVLQGFTATELQRRVSEIHPESFNQAQAAIWAAIE